MVQVIFKIKNFSKYIVLKKNLIKIFNLKINLKMWKIDQLNLKFFVKERW